MSFRYGASWRDDAFWGDETNPTAVGNLVPAHTRVNARVTWVAPDQEWEASLFCTNCTDVRTQSSTLNFLGFFGQQLELFFVGMASDTIVGRRCISYRDIFFCSGLLGAFCRSCDHLRLWRDDFRFRNLCCLRWFSSRNL